MSGKPTKFVRHRDMKMKGSELQYERKIQQLMCEDICEHCVEKVKWKFTYDKYKPLRHPGTCQGCKQRTVRKAYRTLCDACAKQRRVCPSCCVTISALKKKEVAVEAAGVDKDEVIMMDDGMIKKQDCDDDAIKTHDDKMEDDDMIRDDLEEEEEEEEDDDEA